MERELPADAAVLGVDEHTAMLIDLRAEDIEIRGRGGVTVRRSGDSVVLPSGTRLSVADLRDLVRGIRRAQEPGGAAGTQDGQAAGTRAGRRGDAGGPGRGRRGRRRRTRTSRPSGRLPAAARDHGGGRAGVRGGRGGPGRRRDGRGDPRTRDRDHAVGGRHRRGSGHRAGARAAAQPHRPARAGGPGRVGRPRDRLRPVVEPLIALRTALRGEGNFAAADAIREALAATGLDVSDTPDGPRWRPTETVFTGE